MGSCEMSWSKGEKGDNPEKHRENMAAVQDNRPSKSCVCGHYARRAILPFTFSIGGSRVRMGEETKIKTQYQTYWK